MMNYNSDPIETEIYDYTFSEMKYYGPDETQDLVSSIPEDEEYAVHDNVSKQMYYVVDDEMYYRYLLTLQSKPSKSDTAVSRFKNIKEHKYRNSGRPSKNNKVLKYDKEGNLVAEYGSRKECIEKDNLKKSSLSLCLSGKRKYYKGFRYVESAN